MVDDGSIDHTAEICDAYAQKFNNIQVIHQENKGQNAARLAGTVIAQGDYIGFVDSDDWIEPKMYEELWQQANAKNADMVCCGCIYEKEGFQEIRYNTLQEGMYHKKKIWQEVLPNVVSFGSDYTKDRLVEPHLVDKLFKKGLILHELSGWNHAIFWGEDVLITLKCIANVDSMVVLKYAPYHYRIHQESILRKQDKRAISSYSLLLNELLDFCDKNHICKNQVQWYGITAVREMLRIGLNVSSSKYWQFPYKDFEKEQCIVIYGAGNVGVCYYNQIIRSGYFANIIWTDSDKEKVNKDNRIRRTDEALNAEYNKVIIEVEKECTAMEIKQQLLEKSIPSEKIYWTAPITVSDTFTFGISLLKIEQ